MNTKSEYFATLSPEAAKRYTAKVTLTGLMNDPYAIAESEWTDTPERIPQVSWTSPYAREEIKVS